MGSDVKVSEKNPVPVGQVPPSSPAGTANKEIDRAPSLVPEVKPAGQEVKHKISPEIAKLGVMETPNRPDLTEIADVQHAGPHVPVSSSASGKIVLPISEEEITKQLETGRDDDSGTWYAALWKKIIAWGSKPR